MNSNHILKYILFALGLTCVMSSFLLSSKDRILDKQNEINLALRQTVHSLYKDSGDATSRIKPIEKITDYKFAIELTSQFNYDTLPHFLDMALADFDIESKYYVTINDCDNDIITLGFNNFGSVNNDIPCKGRDLESTECYVLSINFIEEVKSYAWLLLLAFPFVLGGLYLSINRNKEETPERTKEETLKKIGRATFDNHNLVYNHGGAEKKLTFREARLLNYFIENENQVLKREDIQDNVWEDNVLVGRSLDVFISRLRKIMKEDTSISIDNIHGVGYKLVVNK